MCVYLYINIKFIFTSYSARPFAEYAAVKWWFLKGCTYAESEDYHDNSNSEGKTSGNHVESSACTLLK